MDITAEHRFERPLAEVWAMFLDPEAHARRFTEMGHRDLEVLEAVPGDESLAITIVRTVEVDVPSIARKVIKPTNTVTTTDEWALDADGTPTGHTTMEIRHVPLKATSTATLVPDGDDACTYAITLSVSLSVPLVGDRIAKALSPQLREQLEAEFAACETWLAEAAPGS